MLKAIFREERQKEKDGLQPKLCDASDNNSIDSIGLDFQLLNGLERERKREECSATGPTGPDRVSIVQLGTGKPQIQM